MSLTIEVEHESNGRWLAEALELPGVMTYGQSAEEAVGKAQVLALRVVADRLEHGEPMLLAQQLFRVIPESATHDQQEEARLRFRRHFGEVDLGRPNGSDNDSIDDDLVREYGDTHETV